MKKIYISVLIFVSIFISDEIKANNHSYTQCNGCTSSQMLQASAEWASSSFSQLELQQSVIKNVSVINLLESEVRTYQVSFNFFPASPTSPQIKMPTITEVFTPKNITLIMQSLESVRVKLTNKVNEQIIPSSVISNAWLMTNCAFCENNIQTYINNSVSSNALIIKESLAKIIQLIGIVKFDVPEMFRIKLEAGGYVEIKASILLEPNVTEITVINVVDVNGNQVPLTHAGLSNMKIDLPSVSQAKIINGYINRFFFQIPIRKGIATITICPNVSKGSSLRTCKGE